MDQIHPTLETPPTGHPPRLNQKQALRPAPSRLATGLLIALTLTGTAWHTTASAAPSEQPVRPQPGAPAAGSLVADQYIVTFSVAGRANPAASARQLAVAFGGQVRHVYQHAFVGATLKIPAVAARNLARHPLVAAVEPDRVATIGQTLTTQPSATFGLDRVNQRALPLDGAYSYGTTASASRVYVVDTGILSTHVEFNGRVLGGYTAIGDGWGTTDCNGHGTHVAGTAAGTTYGVAKQAQLIPVRVLGCDGSGSYSGVIAGVDWIAANAGAGAVANLSLGGPTSTALDSAITNLVGRGVVVVVAAGNSNADACQSSPARVPAAITVGATTSSDSRASYSNFGSCVDLFAPGSGIVSAWFTSNTATASLNGTSMASPHVAGVAALVRTLNPGATAADVTTLIKQGATSGVVASAGTGSPNLMLYALVSLAPAPSTPVALAGFTSSTATVRKGKTVTWTWDLSARVYDPSGSRTGLSGVTITGVVDAAGRRTVVSCVTDSTSACRMPRQSFDAKTVASATWTVQTLAGSGYVYKPESNTATTIGVTRP